MKRITIQWTEGSWEDGVFKCMSASYGPDSRNLLLRGIWKPAEKIGMADQRGPAAMLIPLDGVRAVTEEEW